MYIKHSCDTFGTIWMPYVHPIWLKCSLVSGRPIRYFYCFLTHFQPSVVFGRSTLVGYYVRLFVRLSVCPSVRASLSFLKIGSLVFSDIVHDDSWSWHLVTDGAWFLKKKKKKLTAKGPKSGPKLGFLKFGSLLFLEITYNDILQQCLPSSRAK